MLAATRNFVYNTFFILSLLFVFILLPFGVSLFFFIVSLRTNWINNVKSNI